MLLMIKKMVHKIFGESGQNFLVWLLIKFHLNNRYLLFTGKKAVKNRVNINYCHNFKNIGDNISPVIIQYAASSYGVDYRQKTDNTCHLYGVGSIITAGAQDCTIWGSGLLNSKILGRLANRKLDVRAVRGPLTRIILLDRGYMVPEIYGDPAILMPLIFRPEVTKKYSVSVITHMNEEKEFIDRKFHTIDVVTDDYKYFIEEICASDLVISSSLHGIILAESYGVPAVLLRPQTDLFKYFDYYYSTQRYSFPIADTVETALLMTPPGLPELDKMREDLLKAFPADLWVGR